MNEQQSKPSVCPGSSTTSAAVTRKWIELINTVEKDNANKPFRT